MAVNRTLFANLRYDALTDLVPIVLIDRGPLVLMVPLKSPLKTVQDVVAAAKAKPGTLTFASGGIGGTHHLSGEVFKQTAGIDLIHIPYKSGSAATTDLLGGNVDMMFEQMYAAKPSLEGGKLRPLAITSRKRSPQFPAIPSFAEAGYPEVEVLNWQGLVAPKGTPRAIVDRLNAAVNKVLADAKVRESITAQSNEVVGGTPEEFAALIKSESAKWGAVVRAAHIKPE
jgi:tripartite-type tricarboxylate transporter receptor subunit TctC